MGRHLAHFGAKLENVSVGCCGMAGTYGHELTNHKNSLGIYELSRIRRCNVYRETVAWQPAIPAEAVKRIEGTGVRHPLQALLEIIG